MSASALATCLVRLGSTLMPSIACRAKPSWSGSDTAVIWMTPASVSCLTRWITESSLMPSSAAMLS